MSKTASPTKCRYEIVTAKKADGATYTPASLADFVATQITQAADISPSGPPIRIFDPAVGEGELLASLLAKLPSSRAVSVSGFDTNPEAVRYTQERLTASFSQASVQLEVGDFLQFVLENYGGRDAGTLFQQEEPITYDLIIANPPYVRTQIIGATYAQRLAQQFGLTGRVDLYHAFVLGMARVLSPAGVAGIIISNRFMTTKAGASVRQAILKGFDLLHVWDLGDTKLFDAAVLPAVLLASGQNSTQKPSGVAFTSIYESTDEAQHVVQSPIDAISQSGVSEVADGRRFLVQHGVLDDAGGEGVWRVATDEADTWLATVRKHTWRVFRDIGKVRVGVKTCADKVFIGTHWGKMKPAQRPELLRALTTHHIARRFKAENSDKQRFILYPHEIVAGRRQAVSLSKYPRSRQYLEDHRSALEARSYVLKAGRKWYEVWVPQDPAAWSKPKLVFRDISKHPCFWIDLEGSVVNGDCYWITPDCDKDTDLLWLAAAVANSTFIEAFYDHQFNNKLYAGRRRFITQYVEQFPLPDATSRLGKQIIAKAKAAYEKADSPAVGRLGTELNLMVWQAFGLPIEEVSR